MSTKLGHSVASIASFSAPGLAFVVALTIGLVFGPTDKPDESQRGSPKSEEGADPEKSVDKQAPPDEDESEKPGTEGADNAS